VHLLEPGPGRKDPALNAKSAQPNSAQKADARLARIYRRALAAWCLFDFGIAAWPVVVATFVWGAYYATAIRRSPEDGAAEWGATLALAGFVVAILGPILGAIADRGGARKPWIGCFVMLCAAFTAFLWFSLPVPSAADRTLLLIGCASIVYEFSLIFYNAMMRDIVAPDHLGRLSGWGWGAGYVGGLACLAIGLYGFIKADHPPFGLEKVFAEPVRATALLVAVWICVFTLPLFGLVPDRKSTGVSAWRAIGAGLKGLGASLMRLPHQPQILRFLLARMIYGDGLNTLFIFGGIYAAGVLGFTIPEVALLGIGINATAGAGAILFAWIDDRIGSKPTIFVSLIALIALGSGLLFVHSQPLFWALALALGVFVGPAQAASRTFMARLCPPAEEAEMFGLYALSGKITAFIGPALYGLATHYWESQRAGMTSVVVLLTCGLLLLLTVRSERS
jgi:MFS transporter, UMF1 family